MPLSSRFTIVISFLLLVGWFLEPTYVYYLSTPSHLREAIEKNSWKEDATLSDTDKTKIEKAVEAKSHAITLGLDIKGGVSFLVGIDTDLLRKKVEEKKEEFTKARQDEVINQIITGLKNRINQFGLAEITIRKMGDNNISIQIPGLQDVERMVKIIEQQGLLEFHFVNPESSSQFLQSQNPSSVPSDSSVHYMVQKDDKGLLQKTQPLVLYNKVELDGNVIKNAGVHNDQFGEVVVSFEMTPDGATVFSDLTSQNIGKRLAITLDGDVISAPQINGRINGQGQIQGDFDYEEARDLSLILRSGSLPVPIKILSTNTVGPTMGKELLHKSLLAFIFGFLFILFFMLLWYRTFGVIACLALVVNALMVFAILAQMNFTVSLPSLAGVLLTIGVSIDANVIIFERIKDEYRETKNFLYSMESGYGKAFWTIFDANSTTLITTLILAYFGDTFVEGFAFTLFIGILTSMFSALFMTRFLFNSLTHFKIIKTYKKWYL